MKRVFLTLAILMGFFLPGLPPPTARADFILSIYDNGTLKDTVTGTNSLSIANLNTGDFTLNLVGGVSNTPGTAANGSMTISSLQIISNNAGPNTLTMVLSANNYTQPGSPGILSSSGTFTTTGTGVNGTLSFKSFYDTSNTTSTSITGPSGGTVTSTPLQQSTIVGGALTNGSAFSNVTTGLPGVTPYSLTNVTTFTSTSAGDTSNYLSGQGTTAVVSTPAPAGWAVMASVLPTAFIGWFLRRRNQLQLA